MGVGHPDVHTHNSERWGSSMTSRFRSHARRGCAAVAALMLVAAACGSDSKTSPTVESTAAPVATAAPTTAAGDTAATSGATAATTGGSAEATTAGTGGTEATTGGTGGASPGSAGCPAYDTSIDEKIEGDGAQRFVSDLACTDAKPLKAEGEPIVIGFQNPEGDPNGSFPEASAGARAAVEYINNELGGLGADVQNGKPGRPIRLEVCKMAISPDDSQRCANELIAKKPQLVESLVNFFGNHFPIYAAANIPVVVGTPITIGDYTSPNVYAIGGGGGCLGQHTGLVYYATQDLKAKRVAVPWADTPPGVVCYYDLEAKPLDVLKGTVESTSKLAGSIPDLEYLGVPIKPSTPDVTPQVTQILDFKPDAIIFSAQGADCWNFVATLGRLGWTPDKIPLTLSGACVDLAAAAAAGPLAVGINFVGVGGQTLADPSKSDNARAKAEAINYQSKPVKYGMSKEDSEKGFGTLGWGVMMSLWEISSEVAVSGEEVTGATIAAKYKSTENQHNYASTPTSCSTAPEPYVAVCNADASILQWDGSTLVEVKPRFTAIDLVAGTPLKPGP